MKQFEELERGATADVRDLPSDQGREILEGFRAERPNRAGREFYHVNIAEGFEGIKSSVSNTKGSCEVLTNLCGRRSALRCPRKTPTCSKNRSNPCRV